MGDEGLSRRALERLEQALGHCFDDRSLLETALTHRSWRNEAPEVEADNERLEFLGDAVLELAVSDWLFRRHPDLSEGELTRLRARIVDTRSLAEQAGRLDLGRLLRLGEGGERQGSREQRSILADTLEAVIGAVHLDAGYRAAEGAVHRIFEETFRDLPRRAPRDPKSALQERTQGRWRITPRYELLHSPDEEEASFEAEVRVGGHLSCRGRGESRQAAEMAAAERALAASEPRAEETRGSEDD